MILNAAHFTLKLAESEAELSAAQRLRYRVFVEEMGARPAFDAGAGQETDAFDPYCDHLILRDDRVADDRENVVGVYRLMRGDVAASGLGFYSAAEYDLSKITGSGRRVLELGRSCVHAEYRSGLALHLLWQGVADYVVRHDIDLLFGVASFSGTEPQVYADGLSFLHHNHLAPEPFRVAARPKGATSMALKSLADLDRTTAVKQIPSLIKSYLRLGGFVGQDAYLDRDFNTTDVCVILDRALVPAKQLKQFESGVAA